MSSQHVQALLSPPDIDESNDRTILLLNAQFSSLESLDDLEAIVQSAQQLNDELASKVRLILHQIYLI